MTAYVWFVRGEKHAALCATSMESVRRVDPAGRFIVCSDEPQFPEIPGDVARRALKLPFEPGMPIMLANLEAQVQALGMLCEPSERVTFLDTDIILLKPLPFRIGCDLIVTWRDKVRDDANGEPLVGIADVMPYNYGVVGAINSLTALEAFIWMRERVRRLAPRSKQWYGNQIALFALAGPRPESGEALDDRRIPWLPTELGSRIRIRKLPCETWNYTPQAAGEDVTAKGALHFKGPARALMESYANRLGLNWYPVTGISGKVA